MGTVKSRIVEVVVAAAAAAAVVVVVVVVVIVVQVELFIKISHIRVSLQSVTN